MTDRPLALNRAPDPEPPLVEGELFKALFELAPDAVTVSELETGRIVEANDVWCAMTGVARAEALGRTPLELGLWSAPGDRAALFAELRERGLVADRESKLCARGGRVFSMLLTAKVLELQGRRLVLLVGRDVTERDDLARQAREEELRARKAESLVLMAGGIAHDFNNLFQALLVNMEVVEIQSRHQAGVREAIANAKEVLHRAVALSWKMLDFSGSAITRPRPLDLAETLRAWASGLPEVDLDLAEVPMVKADAVKLREVLDVFLVNAREAMAGMEGGRIRVKLAVAGDAITGGLWVAERPRAPWTVCLDFANDGPSPSPEILSRMFDPFFSTKALGRGLGLPAALGLVRAHGAGLQVAPGPAGGLVLRLHFPPG